ncbi:MAG: alpha/beta hydrolase-fold protein [Terriglobales bacterium]
MRKLIWLALLAAAAMAAAGCTTQTSGTRFALSFPASIHKGPITGRAFVFVTRSSHGEPRLQAGGYNGNIPFFGKDVSQLQPGQTAVIGNSALGTVVKSLAALPPGDYYAQALMNVYTRFPRSDGHVIWAHMDHWGGQQFNTSPDNLYSAVKKIHIAPETSQTVALALDQVIPPHKAPQDTPWVKHVKIQSALMSTFWGHPIFMGATVLLPAGYAQHPRESYPVVYVQGHFTLHPPYGFTTTPSKPSARSRYMRSVFGVESGYEFYKEWSAPGFPKMILVTFQTPTPYYDDCYAVNSVNSGPCGDAILQELIPYVETHFRIDRKPSARMLTGGSTGGWESMNLMIKHPDFFGGTWSLYPDPLDFHHFQVLDLYQDANAFWAPGLGPWLRTPRYTARQTDGQPVISVAEMSQAEAAEGTQGRSGQQFDAWFATGGPIDADGYPVAFWNLRTGAINRAAVDYARDHGYDLTAYLKAHWTTLGPKLVNKLRVYVGDMDTYYLNLGVYDMQRFLASTKDPHYAGTFVYGRPEKPHGWNGGMTDGELLRQIDAAIKR